MEEQNMIQDENTVSQNTENCEDSVPTKRKADKAWLSILKSILILAVFLAIQGVTTMILMGIGLANNAAENGGDIVKAFEQYQESIMTDGEMTTTLFIVTIVTMLFALLWYFLGYIRKVSPEKKQEIREKVWNGKVLGLCILAGFACYGMAITISGITAVMFPNAMEDFAEMMDISLSGNMIVMIVTTVILAPIGEEVIFRGVIFQKLLKSNKFAVALILQAILFGVFHGNIIQGLYVLPLALVMGYAVYCFESIIPSIIIHAVNNGISVLLGFLPVSESVQTVVLFLVVILALVGWVVLIKYYRENKKAAA